MAHPRSHNWSVAEAGFNLGLHTVSGNSVKHLEINCRDWLNDERQVRNNNEPEGRESK